MTNFLRNDVETQSLGNAKMEVGFSYLIKPGMDREAKVEEEFLAVKSSTARSSSPWLYVTLFKEKT